MSGTTEPVATPVAGLAGRYCRLRPVVPADYAFLFDLELGGPRSSLYRHRGVAIAPEQYPATLWAGVLSQWIVTSVESGEPLGLVAAFGADMRNGHARIAGILAEAVRRRGWPLEGYALFLTYLFRTFPLRKVYADVLEPNLADVGGVIGRIGHLEGSFPDHEVHDGGTIALHTYAIYRDEWLDRASTSTEGSVLAQVLRPGPPT